MKEQRSDILAKILQAKANSIKLAKQNMPLLQLQKLLNEPDKTSNIHIDGGVNGGDFAFFQTIKKNWQAKKPSIIAEIKRASPSAGIIMPIENFDAFKIAQSYQSFGATCLSILTEEDFFRGKNEYIAQAGAACSLPILRKDFIIDEYQIYETKLLGASCILLIVACLDKKTMAKFLAIAHQLRLTTLIEVHNQQELETAMSLNLPKEGVLIGVNNRNLKTLETDINISLQLKPLIPSDYIVIAESGIKTAEEIKNYMQNGIYGFLIGESLMKQKHQDIFTSSTHHTAE